MKILTAKELLSAPLKVVSMNLPSGGVVLIQEPTGHKRSEYEAFVGTLKDDPDAIKILRAYSAIHCLVNKDGENLFKADEADQVNRSMSAKVLEDILDIYNGLMLNDTADIEDAAKK